MSGGQGRATAPAKVAVAAFCLLWSVPTIGILVTSLRTPDDARSDGWWNAFLPPTNLRHVTLQNYADAIARADLVRCFINSMAISLPATFIPIVVAAYAAYAFAFMRFPLRDGLFIGIVALLVVPNYVSFVPILKLYGDLQLRGTFAAGWLAHIGYGMALAVYLLRNYMAAIPRELAESARVDGASHYQIFWRLVMPLSLPAVASFAIFQFLWTWNDLLVALIFVGPGANEPITIAVKNLIGQQGQGWQMVTAGGLFSMIVPIAVFLLLQRYFIRGLTAGAVEG